MLSLVRKLRRASEALSAARRACETGTEPRKGAVAVGREGRAHPGDTSEEERILVNLDLGRVVRGQSENRWERLPRQPRCGRPR